MRRFLPFAALLGVAFVLGCQEQGPVGPDGLVPQFAKGGNKNKDDRPTYFITVTGDISSPTKRTRAVRTPELLIVDDVSLKLSPFFDGKLATLDGTGCGELGEQPGSISIGLGRGDDHLHLFFSFERNGATHNIGFLLDVPPTWPPTDVLTLSEVDRQWAVRSTSKKTQKDACTGAGEADEDGIDFTILIEPVV